MTTRKHTLRKVSDTLGAVSLILWSLVLGPVGLLAGLGLCYSATVHNVALRAICWVILGSPLVMIFAWALFAWRAIIQEERAETQITTSPVAPARTTDRIAA